MNIRENVMAVLHHEKPERIPWLTYDIPYPMLPRGSWERELRNMGLGIIGLMGFYPCGNVYLTDMPNVEIEQKATIQGNRRIVTTIYHTPAGSVSKKEDLSLSPPNPWVMEYPIKSLSDYEVVKIIFEDTFYEPNYEAYFWADKYVGGDGFVRVDCKTPFQSLLLNFMGYRTLAIGAYRHRKEFEELLRVMEKKYFEIVRILADSPAEVVGIDGNINGRVASPRFFERYLLPSYKKASEVLHGKNKIVSVHMDGGLACPRDLIPKAGIDVVEAFPPPPLGDLPLRNARDAWGEDMIIEANYPETICVQGTDAVKAYTKEMLRTVAPGDDFILSVTEDIPYKEPNDILERSLRAITEAMLEHGKYPIKL